MELIPSADPVESESCSFCGREEEDVEILLTGIHHPV